MAPVCNESCAGAIPSSRIGQTDAPRTPPASPEIVARRRASAAGFSITKRSRFDGVSYPVSLYVAGMITAWLNHVARTRVPVIKFSPRSPRLFTQTLRLEPLTTARALASCRPTCWPSPPVIRPLPATFTKRHYYPRHPHLHPVAADLLRPATTAADPPSCASRRRSTRFFVTALQGIPSLRVRLPPICSLSRLAAPKRYVTSIGRSCCSLSSSRPESRHPRDIFIACGPPR